MTRSPERVWAWRLWWDDAKHHLWRDLWRGRRAAAEHQREFESREVPGRRRPF